MARTPVDAHRRPATLRERLSDSSGQDTIEWAAVLLVVAVLVVGVAALTPGIVPNITHGMRCMVDRIFGQSCESTGYVVSSRTKTVGWNGRVLIADGSHEFTVIETRYSDGHVTISLQNDAHLGVSAQAGVTAELGSLDLEAQASAGIGGYGDGSTTWSFPNAKQADSVYAKLTQGSGLGTFLHDATSGVPVVSGVVGGILNDFGAHGAPSSSSVNRKYLTSQGYGGGIQASASATASAEIPEVVSAQVSASIGAAGGFAKIVAGPQKGDWQEVVDLNAQASGSVSSDLLGADASATGQGDGSILVTMSPSGQLLSLEVDATGTGTWGLQAPTGPRAPSSAEIPGSPSEGGDGSGSSGSSGTQGPGAGGGTDGGSGSDGGDSEPLLKVDHDASDEKGVGSQFTGDLDLTENPDAAAAVSQVLHGNLADVPTVIGDMNSEGTETVRSFTATSGTDNYGADANLGVGVGAGLDSSSGSTQTVGHPETRTDGGPWEQQ